MSCLLLVFILGATVVINGAPSYFYKYTHGISSEPAVTRSGLDAELYGLKIIQLLLPSYIHRFPSFAQLTQSYNDTMPLVNENSTASLGLMGAIGLLYSLLFLFRGQRSNTDDDYLSFVNIFCVLLATIGGFGAVVGFLISPMIRGYNRISVIIGFISIAVFCRLVQHIVSAFHSYGTANSEKKNVIPSSILSLLLLGIVFVDQCYIPNFVENYQQIKVFYNNDEQFAKRIDKGLPDGTMIFQLPFMPFPEYGAINNMHDYDHFRPYLFTDGLRWSYGGMKGRYASDWNKYTAQLPTEAMLQRLAAAGFSGIYIDRFGYSDGGKEIETKIRFYVNVKPISSKDKRFVFYDLREYAKEYRAKFSEEQWREISEQALELEPRLIPSEECSPMEAGSGNQWIWCGDQGELIVLDYGSESRNVILSFDALTGTGADALLFVRSGSWEEQFKINGTPQPIQFMVPIQAGKTFVKISLESNAQEVETGDPRELVFRLNNPKITVKEVAELP